LVPTKIMGTLGAWCSISGNHCKERQVSRMIRGVESNEPL
jgi:uncharacterized radical SAM superfamily protein